MLCCESLGKNKSKLEKVCSIMAQLEYRYQVNTWDAKGIRSICMSQKSTLKLENCHVNAKMKVMFLRYVKVKYTCNLLYFYDVLHIDQSLRKGGPLQIRLERFEEALHDTTAGLTYSALSGGPILQFCACVTESTCRCLKTVS